MRMPFRHSGQETTPDAASRNCTPQVHGATGSPNDLDNMARRHKVQDSYSRSSHKDECQARLC